MNPLVGEEGILYVIVIILKFQNGQPLMVACKAGSAGMVQGTNQFMYTRATGLHGAG